MDAGTLDELLRALAHADRRAFVVACRDQEQSAGDLAALSELSLATVSEHLKVLRKTGLLWLERRGRFWMYRTDTALLAEVADQVAQLGGQAWGEKR
ncbi:transcriptional regulator, ArsR family [Quadrisphaera granulorum]|uniref:ArsR family transcriptional regulator n=1 Tax=Quadrisphaera granulorum TaxID=317664 RepID=A0A315ZMW4_9ACTN|nr:metalloregulator ArsR/SmtB family transcription factor [Quadrisphaera granulorum]PWJ46975.1 ArsR family transcriptional regulator [Quadrisphaera granulorum]SZE98971.1 transcriptional regulator, ArsR family [Quadrisphaera granulorum]